MTRPTKERLEEIRSLAFVTNYNSQTGSSPSMIEDLLTEIDALTAELKASEWVRRDNSLRTYDGLTEENERLREHLAYITKTRDTYADMLKHSLDHHKQCHGECSFIFAHSDDTQAASNCQHVYGDKGLTCFKCGQDVSHLKETHE